MTPPLTIHDLPFGARYRIPESSHPEMVRTKWEGNYDAVTPIRVELVEDPPPAEVAS